MSKSLIRTVKTKDIRYIYLTEIRTKGFIQTAASFVAFFFVTYLFILRGDIVIDSHSPTRIHFLQESLYWGVLTLIILLREKRGKWKN